MAKLEYPLTVGQERAGPGVLNHHGLPAREIADGAVAHPGVLEPDARRLGRAPLPASALAKLDDDWSKSAATKDADRVVSFYAEDAVVNPPNESAVVGREAAKKVWASYFAAPNFSISWKTTTAEVSKSGELGFTAGTYEDSFDGPDGKRVQETGKYLCVWRKERDGSWKATYDMWNSDSK